MVRDLFITAAVITAIMSTPALAQSKWAQSNQTIVREATPTQRTVILANSPQDIALQEEIRRIHLYNAHIDTQVGISDGFNQNVVRETLPNTPIVNKYAGHKVELYAPAAPTAAVPTTRITYASASGQTISVVPTTTIIRRQSYPGTPFSHRVVKGDTLYSLARTNCVSVADIRGRNALTGNAISLGQTLNLPANQCNTLPASATIIRNDDTNYIRNVEPLPTSITTSVGKNYAVLPKDTLYSIGKRYCLKAQDLATFNGISTRDAIQPGQILSLPSAACK